MSFIKVWADIKDKGQGLNIVKINYSNVLFVSASEYSVNVMQGEFGLCLEPGDISIVMANNIVLYPYIRIKKDNAFEICNESIDEFLLDINEVPIYPNNVSKIISFIDNVIKN